MNNGKVEASEANRKQGANMAVSILPKELAKLHQDDATIDLIDVRTPVEYRQVHVHFARNVPLDHLNPEAIDAERDSLHKRILYVICQSGTRGKQACRKLEAAGLNVVNVEGGTLAWEAAGLPVEK